MPQLMRYNSPSGFEGSLIESEENVVLRGVLNRLVAYGTHAEYDKALIEETAVKDWDYVRNRIEANKNLTGLRYGRCVAYSYISSKSQSDIEANLKQGEDMRKLVYPREEDINEGSVAGVTVLGRNYTSKNFSSIILPNQPVDILIKGFVWVRTSVSVRAGEKCCVKIRRPTTATLIPRELDQENAGRIEPESIKSNAHKLAEFFRTLPDCYFVKTTKKSGMAILYADFQGYNVFTEDEFWR